MHLPNHLQVMMYFEFLLQVATAGDVLRESCTEVFKVGFRIGHIPGSSQHPLLAEYEEPANV